MFHHFGSGSLDFCFTCLVEVKFVSVHSRNKRNFLQRGQQQPSFVRGGVVWGCVSSLAEAEDGFTAGTEISINIPRWERLKAVRYRDAKRASHKPVQPWPQIDAASSLRPCRRCTKNILHLHGWHRTQPHPCPPEVLCQLLYCLTGLS